MFNLFDSTNKTDIGICIEKKPKNFKTEMSVNSLKQVKIFWKLYGV